MASANAMARIMAGRIRPEASGFLPMASMAFMPIRPMARPGREPPMATISQPDTLSVKFMCAIPPCCGIP